MKEPNKHIDRMADIPSNQPYFDIPESFLKDLENRLDQMEQKKKNKRRFIWFFFLSAIVSATLLNIDLFNSTSKQETNTVSESSLGNNDNIKKAESITKTTVTSKKPSAQTNVDSNKNSRSMTSRKFSLGSKKTEKENTNQINTTIPIDTYAYTNDSIDDTDLTTRENNILSSENHSSEGNEQDSIASQMEEKTVIEENSTHLTEKKNNDSLTLASSKKWLMEIQFYTGIGVNLSHNKSTIPEYTSILKSYESQTITPIIGITGSFSYKKLAFGIGIGYHQNSERYTLNVKTPYLKDSTISYIQNDTLYTYTFQYTDTMLQPTTFKNQYAQLSIPLSFGYRFRKRNFECIPKLGIQFEIGLLSRYGSYPADKPFYITTLKSKSFSVSYALQIELRRNIGNWHIFATPYFRSSITPNISEAMLNRKYSSYGILIGAGYRF